LDDLFLDDLFLGCAIFLLPFDDGSAKVEVVMDVDDSGQFDGSEEGKGSFDVDGGPADLVADGVVLFLFLMGGSDSSWSFSFLCLFLGAGKGGMPSTSVKWS